MTVNINPNNEPERVEVPSIEDLLKKNLELSNEILRLARKTNNQLMWQSVFGVLKLFIIIIPLIIGFLYLPPIIEQLLNSYKEALGIGETVNTEIDDLKKAPSNLLDGLLR
jgi:hypothetical protein